MNKGGMNKKCAVVLASIVLLTTAYVFSRLIFNPGTILGYRDASHFYYPLFLYLHSCFQSGELPFWTPYLDLGFPLAANPTTALFYPPTWILALPIPAWLSFNLYIIGHVILATGTMFFLVRRWGRSISAGIVAAFSYGFGGIVLFQYSNLPFLVSAAWLPLGVYGIERALRTRRLLYICLSGMALALMTLGGDVQTAYHLGILGLILALIKTLKDKTKNKVGSERREGKSLAIASRFQSLLFTILVLAGIAACGFVLSAIQILPTTELTLNSDRCESRDSIAAEEQRYAFSVPPWRVLEFAVPEVYGRQFPVYQRWIDALPGSDAAFWVPSLYMGTIPFFLACWSFTARRSNSRRVWISWIVVLALLASMGRLSIGYLIQTIGYWTGTDYTQSVSSGWGGLYWLLTSIFPGYGMFRYPAKWLTVASMGISVLSAYGWDRLWTDSQFRYRIVVSLGITAIAVIAWYFIAPTILPHVTNGLTNIQYGPYQSESEDISTFTLQFASAFLLIAVCCLLKKQKNRQLNSIIVVILFLFDLCIYSNRLLTPVPASVFDSKAVQWSEPCRRICQQGNNWLPTAFRETSSVNRESELAQWNSDSFYAYNGLYQHATTMRYGGTFMLKNYAQFLREGRQRKKASEKPFCEQIMTFDGEKIIFKKNDSYQANTDYENTVVWQGTNRFSVVCRPSSKVRIPAAYYPGWTATFTRTTADGLLETRPARVYESDGLFLTIDAPDSNVWTATFQFSPQSVYIGAVITLGGWLSLICAFLFGKFGRLSDYFQKNRKKSGK